ncbi:hypothetical protein HYH02_011990 [Chlamydomonas schloesseri]|uniref:Protein kinase domain-containing protein n=1 Tax=Chlamydomonas schloesseri TaxID=2026947 RepID=A0A835TB95_9CHLO|nr:hypothetical protein HYH02_011990 [Chlamydomonas schloesseri]|eukprot:KAG2434991.1 hypothetical protein HYH02_011990 [Chlamydomonas schloesseri]
MISGELSGAPVSGPRRGTSNGFPQPSFLCGSADGEGLPLGRSASSCAPVSTCPSASPHDLQQGQQEPQPQQLITALQLAAGCTTAASLRTMATHSSTAAGPCCCNNALSADTCMPPTTMPPPPSMTMTEQRYMKEVLGPSGGRSDTTSDTASCQQQQLTQQLRQSQAPAAQEVALLLLAAAGTTSPIAAAWAGARAASLRCPPPALQQQEAAALLGGAQPVAVVLQSQPPAAAAEGPVTAAPSASRPPQLAAQVRRLEVSGDGGRTPAAAAPAACTAAAAVHSSSTSSTDAVLAAAAPPSPPRGRALDRLIALSGLPLARATTLPAGFTPLPSEMRSGGLLLLPSPTSHRPTAPAVVLAAAAADTADTQLPPPPTGAAHVCPAGSSTGGGGGAAACAAAGGGSFADNPATSSCQQLPRRPLDAGCVDQLAPQSPAAGADAAKVEVEVQETELAEAEEAKEAQVQEADAEEVQEAEEVGSPLELLRDVGGLLTQLAPTPPGALGTTWQGTWCGRAVAVKLVCCSAWGGPNAPLLRAACRAARAVQHPNLVPVYAVRVAALDTRAFAMLDPPPRVGAGWAASSAGRTTGRLQRFLAAPAAPLPPPLPVDTTGGCCSYKPTCDPDSAAVASPAAPPPTPPPLVTVRNAAFLNAASEPAAGAPAGATSLLAGAAAAAGLPAAPAAATGRAGSGGDDAASRAPAGPRSLTVYPAGDLLPPAAPRPAEQAAALRALSCLRLQPGGCVVAVIRELCDMGNLCVLACAPETPFRASRTWPLHVARRALLRTAREIAAGLAALHAAGVPHGALTPTNVLLSSSSAADRRGFTARVSEPCSPGLSTTAGNALAALGPAMTFMAPELLVTAATTTTTTTTTGGSPAPAPPAPPPAGALSAGDGANSTNGDPSRLHHHHHCAQHRQHHHCASPPVHECFAMAAVGASADGRGVSAAEQAAALAAGCAADVYSYGMLLYLMAAGEMPFAGEHLVPVLMAVSTEGRRPHWPPPPPPPPPPAAAAAAAAAAAPAVAGGGSLGQHAALQPLYAQCVAAEPGLRPTMEQVLAQLVALEAQLKAAKRATGRRLPPPQRQPQPQQPPLPPPPPPPPRSTAVVAAAVPRADL